MVFLGRQHHANGRCGRRGIHAAAHGRGEHVARIAFAHLITGHVLDEGNEVGQLSPTAGNHQAAAQGILQTAFLDVVEHGVHNLAAATVDNLGNIADRHLLERRFQPDLQHFFAQGGQLAGQAGAKAFLDFLCQLLGNGALRADIVGNHPAGERNGRVVAHDAAVVNGNGSYACTHVHQGHAAGHFVVGENGTGHHFRQEVFLGDGNVQLVENLVQGGGGAAVAHKHLEVAFQGGTQGTHHFAFHQLDFVVDGEGLGHGAVHDLALRIGEGIGLQGDGLEALHLFRGDVVVRIGAFDTRCGRHLCHLAAGHAHHHLQNLDHEFLLRLVDGLLQAGGRLHGIGDEAGADALRRGFLVIDNLDVLAVHARDAQAELRGPQVNRGNVFFFHIVFCFIFCKPVVSGGVHPPACTSRALWWEPRSHNRRSSGPVSPLPGWGRQRGTVPFLPAE